MSDDLDDDPMLDRARELWPGNEPMQREWMRAVRVRDELLGITTIYWGVHAHHHEENHDATPIR